MTSIQYDKTLLDDLQRNVQRHLDNAAEHEKNIAVARDDLRRLTASAVNARQAAAQYQQLLDHAEGKPAASAAPDPADERAEVLAGYRELIDFLEDNPELPVSTYEGVTVYPHGEARTAEVDRIAKILGVEAGPRYPGDHRHVAFREFGPVGYQAIATGVYGRDDAKPAQAEGGGADE